MECILGFEEFEPQTGASFFQCFKQQPKFLYQCLGSSKPGHGLRPAGKKSFSWLGHGVIRIQRESGDLGDPMSVNNVATLAFLLIMLA